MNQLCQITNLFKDSGNLAVSHIMMSLNVLAMTAFIPGSSLEIQTSAQFKLFALVGQLHKFKLPGSELRKGYCKPNELWIMRVAKLVQKILEAFVEEHPSKDGDDGDLDL